MHELEIRKRLSEKLRMALGFYYPEARLGEMERRIQKGLQNLPDKEQANGLLNLLLAEWNQEIIDALVPDLSTGETYFFRDRSLCQHFENELLPYYCGQLRNGQSKEINIWSAACSTGEEPYTLALILERNFPDALKPSFKILASDINKKSIAHARKGLYNNWSMRSTPEHVKKQFFVETDSGKWQLDQKIREQVQFEYHNLMDIAHPQRDASKKFDVIFCRNVLMYFEHEQSRHIIERLAGMLNENGWLILSPHDFFQANEAQNLELVVFPELILLRKSSGKKDSKVHCSAADSLKPVNLMPRNDIKEIRELKSFLQDTLQEASPASTTAPASSAQGPVENKIKPAAPGIPSSTRDAKNNSVEKAPQATPEFLIKLGKYAEAAEQLHATQSLSSLSEEDYRLLIQCWTNSSESQKALEACEQAIKKFPLSATFYYLKSNVLDQSGDSQSAIKALKQAIFLEPNFVIAHFALFNVLKKTGKPEQAKISLKNVLRLLGALDMAAQVPESDGLTAAQLLAMVSSARLV